MGIKKTSGAKSPKELQIVKEVQPEQEQAVKEQGFKDFTFLEYNLFWLVHLLIIICTIYLIGGDLDTCLRFFLRAINPLSWL